jgi:ABC-type Fe3+ transport system permease subunit
MAVIEQISHFAASAPPCDGGGFLGFPTWYSYLPGQVDASGQCTPVISGLNDIWLIVAAVVEILLRLGALLAIGFVLYGGISLITSSGDPDKASKARKTILNAVIGLVIAVVATTVVRYLAGRF